MIESEGNAPVVPLAIQFRAEIDEKSIASDPRMTNMTSEAGRVTGYDD